MMTRAPEEDVVRFTPVPPPLDPADELRRLAQDPTFRAALEAAGRTETAAMLARFDAYMATVDRLRVVIAERGRSDYWNAVAAAQQEMAEACAAFRAAARL